MEKVKIGKEKQEAYTEEYAKFKKALREEFFLEGIVIGYAVVEDRLVSFLHHAGVLSRDNEELKINRSVYPYMRRLLDKDDDYSIKIKNISVKVDLICKLLLMTEERAREIDASVAEYKKIEKRRKHVLKPGYMVDLHSQIKNTLDKELIMDIFYELDLWRGKRNQLIHALMSKTVITAKITKRECAENGYKLTRDLDNCLVKPFKEKNLIRKKYKL